MMQRSGAALADLPPGAELGVCLPRRERRRTTRVANHRSVGRKPRSASYSFRVGTLSPLLAALTLVLCATLAGQAHPPGQAQGQRKIPTYVIQIEKVESGEVKLPAEFRLALYENLIEEVRKTGRFLDVYRSGARVPEDGPELLVLRAKVEGFKAGSQRKREVTTVAGATSIKVRVQVAALDGRMLVDRGVEGKVRFIGDNLRATYNWSKSVAKILRQTF